MPRKHHFSPRGLLQTGWHQLTSISESFLGPRLATVSHVCLTSAKAEGTFFCFLKVEGLMLWKTEEKVLPEEKREEDSGKLMLTGRSVEVRKQGKGVWNAGSGSSKAHGGKGVGMGVKENGWHALSC